MIIFWRVYPLLLPCFPVPPFSSSPVNCFSFSYCINVFENFNWSLFRPVRFLQCEPMAGLSFGPKLMDWAFTASSYLHHVTLCPLISHILTGQVVLTCLLKCMYLKSWSTPVPPACLHTEVALVGRVWTAGTGCGSWCSLLTSNCLLGFSEGWSTFWALYGWTSLCKRKWKRSCACVHVQTPACGYGPVRTLALCALWLCVHLGSMRTLALSSQITWYHLKTSLVKRIKIQPIP